MEIELILETRADALRDWLERGHWPQGLSGFTSQQLVTTYWDTPALDLFHAGWALRVREQDGVYRQDLKATTPSTAGLATREEHGWPLAGATPDLSRLHTFPQLTALLARVEKQLVPLMTTDIQRHTARWVHAHGELELAADLGEIIVRDQCLPVAEVELELLTGPPRGLFRAASQLTDALPLFPAPLSKAERGFRCWHPGPIKPADLTPPAANGDLLTGARHWLRQYLSRITTERAAWLAAPTPEGLHQLRVALRHVDAVLRLVRRHSKTARHLASRWQQLMAPLGEARDWDVLLAQVPADARWQGLLHAEQHRRQQHAQAALLSGDAQRLWLDTLGWCETDKPGGGKLRPQLKKTLHRQLARLHAAFDVPAAPSARKLHRLRLRIKRLRYLAELAAPLLPTAPLLPPLIELQTRLGDWHDRQQLQIWLNGENTSRNTPLLAAEWREYQQLSQALHP